MIEAPERPPRERRLPYFLILGLMLAAVLLASVGPFRQLLAQERQVDLTRTRLAELEQSNAGLEEEIRLLDTPAEIERIAREEHGLVMPGELGYVAVTPPGRAEPAPAADSRVPEERRWWQRLWDFVTGRDLDPDG